MMLQMIAGAAALTLLTIGALFGLAGITDVDPGEAVIMIQKIGTHRGMQEETLDTGLHWVNPVTYDVVTYDTRLRQYDLADVPSSTADGQPILVDLSLEMGLIDANIPYLHENIGKDYYDQVVYPALRSSIRNNTTLQLSDTVYTGEGRKEIQEGIQHFMDEKLTPQGIRVTVNLRDIEFTNKQFVATLEQKASAAQQVIIEQRNAEAAEQEAIKMANLAEGEKQQRIKAAEADREERRLKGEGDRMEKEETAKGNLAIATAEAEGVRLRREALSGAGGPELVSIEWARQLGPNIKVYGFPTGAEGTVSAMDLSGLFKGAFAGAGGAGQ